MNSIEGFGSTQGLYLSTGSSRPSAPMSDDQKQQVQSILAKYDPKNLTTQNAQDIFKQISDAGIKFGKDLRDTVKAAGFDTHQLRAMAFQAASSPAGGSQTAPLTDDQKKQVQSILSQFDPKNLTATDAQSIFKQLQQAGIQPGKDLKATIEAAGFNPNQLSSLAAPNTGGVHHHHHHYDSGTVQGASAAQGVNPAALQSLQSILSQYDLKNLNQDQQKSLLTQLDQAGLLKSGDVINIGV
jgi:hypothetical protein